ACPARGQRPRGSYTAPAELAPQPLDAADTRRLPPQVAARIFQAMASPTGDHAAQVHVPATPAAHPALEPRPANARDRLVPRHRNAGSIDPNIGRPSGGQATTYPPRRTL